MSISTESGAKSKTRMADTPYHKTSLMKISSHKRLSEASTDLEESMFERFCTSVHVKTRSLVSQIPLSVYRIVSTK